jgi:perosamine synthetase
MNKIHFAKPSITKKEILYVNDAIENGWAEECYKYINQYTNLLRDYYDVPHAIPTSSGHGALHIILMALNVGPGDEVIVPDLTWIGSVAPISWLGAKPVFVDVHKDSICLCPKKTVEAITNKTKAIIVVHPYGNVAPMKDFLEIGEKFSIPVIEDAAESVGSKYNGKNVGSIGDFGIISTHGTKMLTTGEGGALLTNRHDLIDRITMIENQGRLPSKRVTFWVDGLGLKYKMSNLQAALGLAQLERVDDIVNRRIEIFKSYKSELAALDDVILNPQPKGIINSYWQPTIILGDSYKIDLEERNRILEDFNAKDIALRPVFYPVSMFPMYDSVETNEVSYKIYKRGFNLPSYYELNEEQIKYVCEHLINELERLLIV